MGDCSYLTINENFQNNNFHYKDKNDIIVKSKDEILMKNVCEFFDNKNNLDKMLPIIGGKSNISLRILDWFVTNYAKYESTFYEINSDEKKETIFVHLDYKRQLKAFSKKLFDPFCRRERITFVSNNINITTTVGQLNFFRWAINNQILEYVNNNLTNIEKNMNKSMKDLYNSKGKTKGETRRKRKEINVKAQQTINKHTVKIVVEFD